VENTDGVVPVKNLRNYFRESIDKAMDSIGVMFDPHTSHYVVNIMVSFADSENLYDIEYDKFYGIKPLAVLMANAADAANDRERSYLLQRIGDVSLFISGFFSDSLQSHVVDIDYYANMGGVAYGELSLQRKNNPRVVALSPVYSELSKKFSSMMFVLHKVRDDFSEPSDIDLLRKYEIWRRTGSPQAAKILKKHGVIPFLRILN